MTPTDGVLRVATAPDPAKDPLTLDFVRDQALRVVNGDEEDEFITQLIAMSWRYAERKTRRALFPQTWSLSLPRFPTCGYLVLPKPPTVSVDSITYVDDDGATQTWQASPPLYDTSIPDGPTAGYAVIQPAYDEEWPTTRTGILEAVTVTFTCGYEEVDGVASVPEDISHGRLLVIGEGYKQRSLSVHAFNQNPALIQADALFANYRVF